MPKYAAVGQSGRTPAKETYLRKTVGRITGVAPHVGAGRYVYADLTAGNAKPLDGGTFWEQTSPGILIGYAAGSAKNGFGQSLVILNEKNPKTFSELVTNLTGHLGMPTAAITDKARFDFVPHSVTTRERKWCPGCGLCWAVNKSHRADCTATVEQRIRLAQHHGGVCVLAYCRNSLAMDDFGFLGEGDCVLVVNDPNSILTWAMPSTITAEILKQTWMCTTFCTIGANAAGGPKRLPAEERAIWYDHIEAWQHSLPDRTDLLLSAIDGDAHQWAYAVSSPVVWRSKAEQDVRSAFGKFGYTMRLAWARGNPRDFRNLEHQLFRTKRERTQTAEGLWND